MLFPQSGKGIDGTATQEPEVACISRNRHIRKSIHETVEQGGTCSLQPALPRSRFPFAVHHIKPLFPILNKLWNELRRVLKISINNDNGPTAGVVQPCGHGRLFAEVSRQAEVGYTGIPGS